MNSHSCLTLGAWRAGLVAALIWLVAGNAQAAEVRVPRLLPPGSAGDTTADKVLGQLDFFHNTANLVDGFGINTVPNIWAAVAIDKSVSPNRVYVADQANNRVLGWSSVAAFTTHAAANLVIGQPDFTSTVCNNGGETGTSLCGPTGVAVDSTGKLYVADQQNSRVLEYNAPFSFILPAANIPANDVFGQYGSFFTSSCNGLGTNENTLCFPNGVAVDSANNLYVSDQFNHRVLEYNTPEAITAVAGSGDTTADLVFGQFNNFTLNGCNLGGVSATSLCNPLGLALDGSGNLYVADFTNNRVLEYNTPLTTDTTADRVFGQFNSFFANSCNTGAVGAFSLCGPTGVTVDSSGNVYIADRGNNRVLEYNTPLTTDTLADRVFGQYSNFTTNICNNTKGSTRPPVSSSTLCNPNSVAIDSGNNLYVTDSSNNRALEYNTPITTNTVADGVLGQQLFTTNFANFVDGRGVQFTQFGTNTGGIAIDKSVTPNRVYVADPVNNRVLAWSDVAAFTTHAAANLVFGQPNFFVNTCNNGGITASTLCNPRSVAVDKNGNLYVADQNNNRVLEYNTPFTSGTGADRVFGQSGSFTSNSCNNGGVTAKSLCTPVSVAVDGANNVYVGDFSNNRVLEYNTPISTDTTADKVFGQADSFTTGGCNQGGITADSLCGPAGVAVDSTNHVYIGDDNNHRVLEYDSPLTTNRTADRVFGQAGVFTTNSCNNGGRSASSLCNPTYVAVTSAGNLYVNDAGNNRVLEYNTPTTTDTTADRVFGQGNRFTQGSCKSLGPNALCGPDGIALDALSNLYVADANNNRVLEFLKPVP